MVTARSSSRGIFHPVRVPGVPWDVTDPGNAEGTSGGTAWGAGAATQGTVQDPRVYWGAGIHFWGAETQFGSQCRGAGSQIGLGAQF